MALKKTYSKVLLQGLALMACALVAAPAFCGNTTGTVTKILVGPTNANWAFVTLTGSNTALPSCSTAGNQYVIDITTAAGKAAYAAVLSVKLSNNTITLIGSGTCSLDATSETLNQIQL